VEPDYWGGLYYWSSLQHFQQAIEKAGTLDQKKIRDIMATEKFDTALGPFWYDKDRYFVNHPGSDRSVAKGRVRSHRPWC
jgi:ABC-type branched-subunit amino acid transport system substrate-binding protein